MTRTRTPSLYVLLPLLAIGCAPDPEGQSPLALLDDDVVNYVPADRSVELRAATAQPEVMEAPADILSIAEAEEGKALDQVGVSTGFPLSTYAGAAAGGWCSEFVAWAYWRGGCPFTGQRGTYPWMIGGSTQIRDWFVTNSRFVYQTGTEWATYEPQPGDYIRYNNPDGGHSGMVRYADGTTLYTVEGNVNSKVMLRTLRNYKTAYADPANGIDGFGVMTAAQCGAAGGTGGAAGTGGSAGRGGAAGTGGTSDGGAATGGAAGSAGTGGRTGAGGAAGGAGAGGRGGGAGGGSAAGTGGSAGRGGSGGAAGTGGSAATGGTAGTTGAAGSADAGGGAGTSGAGGAAGASGGAAGLAGRGGSTGSAGSTGLPGSGGAAGGVAGAGGTSSGASTTTGVGGNNSASTPVASGGCGCSTGRGPAAGQGLWLLGLAFLLAAHRRHRR